MKRFKTIQRLIIYALCMTAVSCNLRPKNFTYSRSGESIGLEEKININGYYVSERECDSAFYSVYRFFPDGSFTITTTSELFPELIDCIISEPARQMSCKYLLHGFYVLEGDLIKTQVVWPVGNGCTIFRDYRILSDGAIVNISDYVQAGYSNLAYLKNYPSFYENPCGKQAVFYPFNSLSAPK